MYKILMIALGAGLLATSVSAADNNTGGVRIGVVNAQRVINESPQAAKAKKRLEKEFEKRDQDLQKMAKQVQTLQDALEKDDATLDDATRRAKAREFDDLSRELQRRQREFREDLNLRQNQEMATIYDGVNRIIEKFAKKEGYDLIIQEAVYVNPRIDVTDGIIKALKENKDGDDK